MVLLCVAVVTGVSVTVGTGLCAVENSRHAHAVVGSIVKKPKPLVETCKVCQRVWTACQVCE